ncbi:MAG: nucleotidyl transferase AbiEii/AbiGii toxin family protein [Candidatus Aminicenantes bacterium]|nr:MAG: nucleotidyl transferase AbiEii/AbiGii toxin family protein [Candidatus Aminicenantes bacterium]
MIKKRCLENEYIRKKSQEIGSDPILVERAIFAFDLLSLLIKSKIPLIFKGGTSLMLLVPELRRLSIDVDIVTEAENTTLKSAFNTLISESHFKRWDEDKRSTNKEVPKRHFKFYYDSPIAGSELYILLDILQSVPIFPSIVKKPILHPVFKVEKEIEVLVPSINSMTGDKITAFAPKTIGIPYGIGKSMEIIKQLYDLGILFEYISDLREVYDSYRNIARLEAQYRNLDMPVEAFLNDSIETSFLICQSGYKGCVDNEETKELKDGIKRIKSHILGGRYSILQAKEDASKVAFLASMMRDGRLDVDFEEIRKNRQDLEIIKDIYLTDNYSILNKLKKISPESFHLLAVALNVI